MYSLHDHRAVLDHSVGKELPVVDVESFECLPGRGVAATLSGVKVRLTSIIFFNQQSHLELSDISKTLL
jgi:cation transport ATPase